MKEDAPHDVIDGYELIHPVGQGGMAVVWKARTADGEIVALKRLIPSLERDPVFVKMFIEEARVASTLSHRHIVGLRGASDGGAGRRYLVLQWIHGVDLAHFVDWHVKDERPTPWRLVARIGVHVLRGLAAAHGRLDAAGVHSPVYHRDVSPGNVLLDVTRAMDRASMTQPGLLKGKLGYSAHEALRGKPPTSQSDLWSFGVVLWEALVGERLYGAPGIAQLLAKLKAPVPPLAERRPDVPAPIAELVDSLLERDPDNRPVSAEETANWLESQLDERSDERILARAVLQTMEAPGTVPPRIEHTMELGGEDIEELARRREEDG